MDPLASWVILIAWVTFIGSLMILVAKVTTR